MSLNTNFEFAGQLGLSGLESRTARIVAVGDVNCWLQSGNVLPRSDRMRFVSFAEVTAELLADCDPEYVVSPVVAHDFDCIDLAVLLCRLEYTGPYRALSGDLPSPKIIEREIQHLCPTLDFAVIMSV